MKNILTWSALACVSILSVTPSPLNAHGFEGDRFFPPTIATEDPFATDELSFGLSSFNNPPSDDSPKTRELDVTGEFDKEIFPGFALGISGTYINLEPNKRTTDGSDPLPSQDGFDNISLSAKYQLFEDAPHEFILSLGIEVDLGGTGSKSLGIDSFSTYTPTIYFGKGFGDLPNELKYLKPLALTGSAGVAIPGKTLDPNVFEWGVALEYSLPYLDGHVEDIGLPHPFKDIIPLVEFSMETPENRQGGHTTGTINPGILWEGKYCQIGAEAVIPVNAETGPNVGAAIQVQFYIDDLFPRIFGHPLFNGDSK